MLIWTLGGALFVLGAIAAVIYGTLPWMMTSLANRQTLVTFCKEGTIKAVMRGQGASHYLLHWGGRHLNDPRKPWFDPSKPRWQVIRHGDADDRNYDDRPWYMKTAGVQWVGWPPFSSIYWYRFAWHELRLKGKGNFEVADRVGIDGKGEWTDFIFAKAFTYVHTLKEVEIADGFAVDLTYVITVMIENPHLALFAAEDWLTITFASADREARDFAGARHFQELLSEKRDPNKTGEDASSFSIPIVDLTDRLHDDEVGAVNCGLLKRYGVRIVSADLTEFDPIGADVQAANRQKYVKEQEAAGIKVVGQSEADVILMKGTNEAEVIALKGKAAGEALTSRLDALKNAGMLGQLLVQTDAMTSPGLGTKVIWANNPFIKAQDGLVDLLDSLGVTPEQLKAMIFRLAEEDKKRTAA